MKWGWLAGTLAVALVVALRWRAWNRIERAAGLLVVAAAGVYSTGVVHLPNLEHLIVDIGQTLGPWTYVLVAVMAFLETGAFIGLVAPGETTIMVGGVIAGQGQIDIVALIALVWACAVAGDVTSFVLGRRLGREFLLRHGPRFKVTHERLEQVERFFDRHGGKAIFLGRFVGFVRAVAPFIAGSSAMPLRRFVPYDVLGAGIWGTTYCLLGYVFWQSFDTLTTLASKGALALGVVIVVVVVAVVAYRYLRVPDNRREARRWLAEQAQRPAVRPVVGALRPVVVPAGRWLARPGRFVVDRLTPGELGLELTTLVAVAAVGAFAFLALLVSVGPGHWVLGSDRRALRIADGLRAGWLDQVAKVLTDLGALWFVAPLALAVVIALVARRRWGEVAVLAVGLGLTVLMVHVAKGAEGRPRPPHELVGTIGAAFPSGHSAYSIAWVAIAVLLARAVPRLAERAALLVAGIAVALLVGLTRIFLRAHWLSDVLAGWGLSAAVFSVCGIVALLVAHVRHNRVRA